MEVKRVKREKLQLARLPGGAVFYYDGATWVTSCGDRVIALRMSDGAEMKRGFFEPGGMPIVELMHGAFEEVYDVD